MKVILKILGILGILIQTISCGGDNIDELPYLSAGGVNSISERMKCNGVDYNSSTHFCRNGTRVSTYGSFSYGSRNYKTVVIGNQTWMAENLNYNVSGSKCYGEGDLSDAEIQANCTKYGRLYDWATAMNIDLQYNKNMWNGSDVNHQGICPPHWHIPSDIEWNELKMVVGNFSHLRSQEGWNGNNNGYNSYGFSALPGGYGYIVSKGIRYTGVGSSGNWWSSTEYADTLAIVQSDRGDGGGNKNDSFYSIRCIKDETEI